MELFLLMEIAVSSHITGIKQWRGVSVCPGLHGLLRKYVNDVELDNAAHVVTSCVSVICKDRICKRRS